MRRRAPYIALSLVLVAIEVLIATRLKHLPFVRGSLGDVLVVVLIYCFFLSLRDLARVRLAVGVFFFACSVEVLQYFELAQALGLRRGGVAWIVLGSTFQWSDILCYLVGCAAALGIDLSMRRLRWRWRGRRTRLSYRPSLRSPDGPSAPA